MPVSPRERKFAAMRAISEMVDRNRRSERALIPPHGTVGVGSTDFDHLLKAIVGEAYLRVLRRGGSPQEAHEEAVRDGNECVRRWNDVTCRSRVCVSGRYELERWRGAGESEADSLHSHYLTLIAGSR